MVSGAAFDCEYTLQEFHCAIQTSQDVDDHKYEDPQHTMSTGSCSTNSSLGSNDETDHPHPHRVGDRTRRLLAALSFERLLTQGAPRCARHRRERTVAAPTNATGLGLGGMIMKDLKPPASLPRSRLVSYETHKRLCSHGHGSRSAPSTTPTTPSPPDDSEEDVFYDAVENLEALEVAYAEGIRQESPPGFSDGTIGRRGRPPSAARGDATVPRDPPEDSSPGVSLRAGDSSAHRWGEPHGSPSSPPSSRLAPSVGSSSSSNHNQPMAAVIYPLPPPPPKELPLRFLRAGKNDPVEGMRRYQETLAWRAENSIDTILHQPMTDFTLIKQHYPHFCHGKGKNGEPCFYEQPPRTDLKALRNGGVTLDKLLRHYAMVSEYQWQYVCTDDFQRSIYIIDLQGIRMGDFVGEVVDFVKRASALSATHYPERAGTVFVIHVPSWFRFIWSVVKPWIDEVTLQKIFILRGETEIRDALLQKIDLENIPEDYGGTGGRLGESPEERTLWEWASHNNAIARGEPACPGPKGGCKFCCWAPPRSY